MSFALRRGPRWWALPLLLLLAGPARAQPGVSTVRELEDEVRKYREPSVSDLLRGTVTADPNNEKHRKALEAEARLVAYRLYMEEYLKPSNPDPARPGDINPQSIQKVFQDYEGDLTALTRNKDQTQAARQIFAHAILERGKEVLKAEMGKKPAPRPIVLMNTARMMARTADLGQGETADALVEILRAPPANNQGAQYWAAHGLHDLLEKAPAGTLTPEQQEKTALALAEFVEKKVTFTQGAPQAETDGYRLLRREAIRALALTRVPAYGDKGKPAWALLKVMSATDIAPEPRMAERAEAAIGLARMRPAKDDQGYQPDYAAQQLVVFGREFASFYQSDYKGKSPSGLPVRILAARLGDELKAMQADVKDPYVGKAAAQLSGILGRMERDDSVTPESLRDWLEANKPMSTSLFKSDPKTAVGTGAGQ
jgi:hypothetical protein